MGSPESEKDHHANEGPLHEVTIARPFAVFEFEVTFDQWDVCAKDHAAQDIPDSVWAGEQGR